TLRILDCKEEGCKAIVKDAPKITDYLCDDCKEHFEKVKNYLTLAGLEYTVNPLIVRGLDYYTKTVFEFVTDALGSQGTVCGGGRYDNLISQLGGQSVAGVGFGMGLERIIMLMEATGAKFLPDQRVALYFATMGEAAYDKAFALAYKLRSNGVRCEIDHVGRGVKSQFKYSDKIGAKFVATIGENELASGEIPVKRMDDGTTQTLSLDDFESQFVNLLG
ncbi:MAG: histidine--tRNA ligase, partial [Clostridia bacterium]|nr:histidine--tRNA ligase [Clostridia bacterium]